MVNHKPSRRSMVYAEVTRGDGTLDYDRMTVARAEREGLAIILCAICDQPARYVDHYWPYHQEACRCVEHYGVK